MGSICMREDKYIAIKLRKEGHSYNQISRQLNIPKSTLSGWLKEIDISDKARQKILARSSRLSVKALLKRNKEQTQLAEQRALKIRREAKKETRRLFGNPLFLVGIALYWAEGYKKGANGSKWKSVSFANSDPETVKVMMRFFKEICKVEDDRIRIQLIAHANLDIPKVVDYWASLTKIPAKQFIKTCCSVSKSSKGKRDKNSLTKGTIHIRINDVSFFFRVIGWIDGLKEYLKGP